MRKVLLAVAAATLAVLPAATARAQREAAGAMDPVAGVERGDAHRPLAVDCPPGVEASPTAARVEVPDATCTERSRPAAEAPASGAGKDVPAPNEP
jgi:hypothetical protein